MKRIIIIFILVTLFCPMWSYCQRMNKEVNLIIVVDEQVAIHSLSSFKLVDNEKNNEKKVYDAVYIPGKLSLSIADYKKLSLGKSKTLFLNFDHNESVEEKNITHSYKIEINTGFLQWRYTVLYIYNLDKKQYQGLFTPKKGCDYVYEINCSEFGALLIRNTDIK